MENQFKTEACEGIQATNGVSSNSVNISSTPDTKKDNRPNLRDSGRDSGRSSRRDRDRNRSRRRSRSPIRTREDRTNKINRRVYVANVPFDVRWGELKDLFRDKVGNVRFCQLFENEEGKPRGCGLVEFEDSSSAKKAIEVLNRFEFRGRELVVKEDLDIERDRYGKLILNSRKENRDTDHRRDDHYDDYYRNGSDSGSTGSYNTFGLSPQFLSSLGIKGPLNNRVFVANLDFKVSERKLEDIFRLAGKILKVKLYLDHDGKSKGFGVVEFEHPVEAVQAISMFNNQRLYDRLLTVRLDKFDIEDSYSSDGLPSKLPSGLEGIGKGLGIGGQPLNIAKSMVNNPSPVNPISGVQSSVAPSVVAPQAASAAITALTNLAGNLQNLPSLAQSLAQLSNSTGVPNSSISSAGYSSPSNELPSVSAPGPSTYVGYQTVPQPGSGNSQPSYAPTQLPPVANYGPPTNVAPVPSYATPAPTSNVPPISSYSTYDQRDYRDEKYRNLNSDTIYVRNLPPNFNWQNLRDRFNEVGEVRFAEMKGHGTALVRFVTSRDAQRACDIMNGIRIENRPIDVDLYY